LKNIFYINNDWQFTLNTKEFLPEIEKKELKNLRKWYNAVIPGTIHTDLLKNKLIPEPFYSDNETRLQWIGESDWNYKTTFNLPKDFNSDKKIELVFEGLDTAARIFLNKEEIGFTENMFRKYSFDVSKKLIAKGNLLQIEFISNVRYAKKLEAEFGRLPVALRSERVYLRKAQYSFGWDWGPAFITMGIWKQVYLLQNQDTSINKVFFQTKSIGESNAQVEIKLELCELVNSTLKLILENNDDRVEKVFQLKNEKTFVAELSIPNPKLWQPNGIGKPFLYNLKVQLIDEKDQVVDEIKRKIGIRTVELKLTENDKPQFQFIINGKPVFAKGANWIPADSFIPRIDEDKYRKLLMLAKEANMNIIRVWGGGIYEDDRFYETCDELGLMVWQDFMFACACYPEHKEFIENVEEEIKQNVSRLQYHPSVILWCGNNENEWIWFQEQKKSYKEMPGYKIYHKVIPEVLSGIDPLRPYWPSTPFGNDEDPNSQLSGNRHQWNIWSMWIDYSKVKSDTSLFVTEFGFQSPANSATFKSILPKEERKTQSRIFEFHNKQVEGPERLFRFLSAHLPVRTELDDFIYLTQLNHGLAMKECLEHWLFRFPKTNGSIIWQLNDCWPVSSWALIDSEIKPKLPYYFVKQAFTPQVCKFVKSGNEIVTKLLNNSNQKFEGLLKIDIISLPEGKIKNIFKEEVILEPECITIEESIPIKETLINDEAIYLSSLYDRDGTLLHRNYYKVAEWKYIKLPEAKVKLDIKKNKLNVSVNKPVFFLCIQTEKHFAENNGMILLPGEVHTFPYIDKMNKILSVNSLNQYCK
jgi:beta-mannosidase